MLKSGKIWWTLILAQCTFVSVVLGAYWGIRTDIVAIRSDARAIEQRLAALEKMPERLDPPAVAAGSADANKLPVVTQPENSANARQASGTQPVTDANRLHDSPVCVNKMTHVVFSCDKANRCLGSNNFDGTYFKGLRAKLGLRESDAMMICDEKSVESPPSSNEAPPGQ